MGRLSTACVALALLAAPASACINDAELPQHEREFRSRYNRSEPPPTPPPSDYPSSTPWLGAGVALLIGGAAWALFGGRSRA
jgi:hypothetical protein